jgi:hypothetical protein
VDLISDLLKLAAMAAGAEMEAEVAETVGRIPARNPGLAAGSGEGSRERRSSDP